ncbi:hypothetical protein AMS68_001610 [Peltaster fructicola]|uniref:Uncharacterized protein n=1 Tax=Peltaster fructicola TaxID=286661 RepID=A0A6H0XMZ4_9PEZI|nr:hypothetical protein AMS68_001610 [Peltaster fructicola]
MPCVNTSDPTNPPNRNKKMSDYGPNDKVERTFAAQTQIIFPAGALPWILLCLTNFLDRPSSSFHRLAHLTSPHHDYLLICPSAHFRATKTGASFVKAIKCSMDQGQGPPWEGRQLTQVPFRPSGGPPTRSSSRRTSPMSTPRMSTDTQGFQMRGEEWQQRPPQASSEAFSPHNAAAGSRPSPEVSSFAHRFLPSLAESPGGMTSPSAVSSHAESVVSPGRSEVRALPGTMSARAFEDVRSSTSRRAHRVDKADDEQHDKHSAGFGTRIKSAMKELFHRRGVDESKLEKIGDRHWSEDAY